MAAIPNQNDILFGKGTAINAHPGNKRFRSIVDGQKQAFFAAVKREQKRPVAQGVMDEAQRLGLGRFLMEDPDKGKGGSSSSNSNRNDGDGVGVHPSILSKKWVCVEHNKVLLKIMHRLRDRKVVTDGTLQQPQQKQLTQREPSESKPNSTGITSPIIHEKNTQPKEAQVENGNDNAAAKNQGYHDNFTDKEGGESWSLKQHSPEETTAIANTSKESKMPVPVSQNNAGSGLSSSTETEKNTDATASIIFEEEDDHNNHFPYPTTGDDQQSLHSIIDLDPFEEEIETWGKPMEDNSNNDDHGHNLCDTKTTITWGKLEDNDHGHNLRDSKTPITCGKLEDNDRGHSLHDNKMTIAWGKLEENNGDGTYANAKVTATTTATATISTPEYGDTDEVDKFLEYFSSRHDSSKANELGEMTLRQWIKESKSKLKFKEDMALFGLSSESSSNINDEILEYVKSALPIALNLTEFLVDHDVDAEQDNGHHQKGQHDNTVPITTPPASSIGTETIEYTLKSSTGEVLRYAKSTLPANLELTNTLTGDGKYEQASSNVNGKHAIPLASIAAECVFIQERYTEDKMVGNNEDKAIEYAVRIVTSSREENSVIGGTMSQLHALGIVLYELFSGEEADFGDNVPSYNPSMSLVSLSNENYLKNSSSHHEHDHPRNKPYKRSEFDDYSKFIERMKGMGIPYSICTLVTNLLDCGREELCGNDAYRSLQAVESDIHLMLNDTSRFLENIVTNPLPTLTLPTNKLYGREDKIAVLKKLYQQQQLEGKCHGVCITGKAGVGKSTLAMHAQKIFSADQSNNGCYFLVAKFDQNKDVKPLSTIGNLFNSLCEQFLQDATPSQIKAVNEELHNALGGQVSLLAGILPSLKKIMPSCVDSVAPNFFVDSAASMQFCALLRVISSHSRSISLLLDDLQWADPLSLLLVRSLLSRTEGNRSVFFICCYRDQECSEPFNLWLNSISMFSLEIMKVESLSLEGVNELISDALHLSPRLTRPLASMLHNKTRGNPLYLRQLMNSLNHQGYIYVDLSRPRWDWDVDRINDLKMSDTVLDLLTEEMQKLDSDLKLGLAVASCIGCWVGISILDILTNDLKVDFRDVLKRLSEKGLMENVGDAFRFGHDKIQQAAYEMMNEGQRRNNHMRLGLAICTHTMNDGGDNDDMFFTAINQINMGGADVLSDPSQRIMIAALNLKAGRRSIVLADVNTAFKLFEHGISFLGNDHWQANYKLSLDLFDSAAEAAYLTNRSEEVTFYVQKLFFHARCPDDKLNGMYAAARAMTLVEITEKTIEVPMQILGQLGETPLRALGDTQLSADMQVMNDIIRNMTDEALLNLANTMDRKVIILLQVYMLLDHVFNKAKPALLAAGSLRMMALTLKHGFCLITPVAMANYGVVQSSLDNVDLAHRLGRLALRLAEKKESARFKTVVFGTVYQSILVKHTPFQSIAHAHIVQQKAGQQSGLFLPTVMNGTLAIATDYAAGGYLGAALTKCREMILKLLRQNTGFNIGYLSLLLVHFCALTEGLHMLDAEQIGKIPGKAAIIAKAKKARDSPLLFVHYAHHVVRTLLFRKFDAASLRLSLADMIFKKKITLRPLLAFALFCEGLIAFEFAREMKDEDALRWNEKGNFILSKMQNLNKHCSWNFENKALLLEAESASLLGQNDRAESLYEHSISCARDHKFVHEEAIAMELTGLFFYRRGLYQKSYMFLTQSVQGFNKWGATAVANRIEKSVNDKFGSHFTPLGSAIDDPRELAFSSVEVSSKKRQEME